MPLLSLGGFSCFFLALAPSPACCPPPIPAAWPPVRRAFGFPWNRDSTQPTTSSRPLAISGLMNSR